MGEFFLGLLLLCIAFPLLWNNERKQVKIAILLSKAEALCLESVDSKIPLPENNFKLIHVSGISENPQGLKDTDTHLEVKDSVKLIRRVEMY